jgi:hypothetical protein
MNKSKIDNFLEKALNKMFQVVGMKKWNKTFTEQPDWYSQKTWTFEQKEEYKKWFLMEIKKDLKLNKRSAEKEWSWFDLMWGWKENSY